MEATAPRPLLARLNLYWIVQLGSWGAVGLFNLMLYSGVIDKPGVIAVCWWSAASGLLLSDLWRRLIKWRRWTAPRQGWRLIAAALCVLGPLQAFSVALAIQWLEHDTIRGYAWMPLSFMFWGAIFLTWNVSYLSVQSLRRATRFEAEALRLEVSAKDAELRALQAQVNPHFFFNSMNSVRGLIFENPVAAARMIDQLSALMRYALQSGQTGTVPLAQELEVVDAYLAIEKIRFEERLRVSLQIDAGLEQVRIPPMSLQTLVENAVKYGVEANPDGSDIRISARRDGAMLAIEIANLGAIAPFANSTRVGLSNARQRLKLSLGEQASLDLSENSGWVKATLNLPLAA